METLKIQETVVTFYNVKRTYSLGCHPNTTPHQLLEVRQLRLRETKRMPRSSVLSDNQSEVRMGREAESSDGRVAWGSVGQNE